MLKLTDKITNPEAIKLINDIQSGVFWAPIKAWFARYRWYFITGLVVIFLLTALSVGKALFRRSQAPVFLPPDIGLPVPSVPETFTSDYEPLRQMILDFGVDLPDPVIPPLDNAINLESANI